MSIAPLYRVGLAIDIIHEKGGQCSFYLQTSEKSRILKKFKIKNQGSFDTTQKRVVSNDL